MNQGRHGDFEQVVLPHLDAAYNLARWLTRNDHDAQDVAQEAVLRAYRFFDGLRGEAKPWLLAIVRNSCFTWLQANRPRVRWASTRALPSSFPPTMTAPRFRQRATAIGERSTRRSPLCPRSSARC